jgi:V8-like Glu-specific endopeptidase
MSITLSAEQLRAITRILAALPEFGNSRERRRLVGAALAGTERGAALLSRLDLEGSPRATANDVVMSLASFGQVAYGQEALVVLLDHVGELVGEEDATRLAEVLAELEGGASATTVRPRPLDPRDATEWRGGAELSGHLERILGENTLRDVRYLRQVARAAEAVVRLKVVGETSDAANPAASKGDGPPGATRPDEAPERTASGSGAVGTGFLVGDGLVMTNHHVVATPEMAARTQVAFFYELDEDGRPRAIVPAKALPGGLFLSDRDLDVTIFEIEKPEGQPHPRPLVLSGRRVRADERVAIVQHPGGHLKKISLQHNFVVFADRSRVQYTTATEPGSSGSPVLDDECQVVAVHHSGGILSDEATPGKRVYCNGGSSAASILKHVAEVAPELQNLLAR